MDSDLQKSETGGRRKTGSKDPARQKKQVGGESGEPKGGKRFEIDIFRDWCKSCGICAAFCPLQCIGLDEDGAPTKVDSRRCTGCGWCEAHCPDFAISIHKKNDE